MKSTSIHLSYFGYIIEFIIPQSGLKWQEQIVHLFRKNFAGYIASQQVKKIVNRKIEFIASKQVPLSSKAFVYIVPLTGALLKKKVFGQLLREILITSLLALTKSNDGTCLHASSVVRNNKAILFVGKSRSGKSTICDQLSPTYTQLTDDISFIVYKKNAWWTCQIPLFEKKVPLRRRDNSSEYKVIGLYFLEQSASNSITKIENIADVLPVIIENTFYVDGSDQLSFVHLLVSKIPLYRIRFKMGRTIGKLFAEKNL